MSSPIRLLIAGYCTQKPGGVESFIRNIAFGLPKEMFQVSVLSFDQPPSEVTESFAKNGVRFFSPGHELIQKKREKDIYRIIDEIGPLDIIHCNGVTNSWRWLKGATEAGIPVRIFHGHAPVQKYGGFFRELYIRHLTIPLLSRYATECVFCSEFVKDQWVRLRPSDNVLPCSVRHCGLDFSSFSNPAKDLRASLGIPEDAILFGQIGRFTRVKNHSLLVEIFKEIAALEPRAHFLLVGSGQQESRIRSQIDQAGLTNRFTLSGRRSDIRDVLAMYHVFIITSFFEGLPLVAVEAQAAGIPCLCSTGIAMDACLIPGMISCLSVHKPAREWAEQAIQIAQRKFPSQQECLSVVRNSSFEISNVTQSFVEFYRNCFENRNT